MRISVNYVQSASGQILTSADKAFMLMEGYVMRHADFVKTVHLHQSIPQISNLLPQVKLLLPQ